MPLCLAEVGLSAIEIEPLVATDAADDYEIGPSRVTGSA